MSAEAWVAIIFGLTGAMIGGWGLFEARRARAEAARANRHADDANRISREANEISERALESSERLVREQIDLQRRDVALAVEVDRRHRTAELQVFPAMKTSHGIYKLRVENRGPHRADHVSLTLYHSDRSRNLGSVATLLPEQSREFEGTRGDFLLGAIAGEFDDPSGAAEEAVELHVTFTDGNGSQLLRKLVRIGQGSRFVDRRWMIENWSSEE